jgi:hypothetical protein
LPKRREKGFCVSMGEKRCPVQTPTNFWAFALPMVISCESLKKQIQGCMTQSTAAFGKPRERDWPI